MKWTSRATLVLLLLGAAAWGNCSADARCPAPRSKWACPIDLRPNADCGEACGMLTGPTQDTVCGLDAADAAIQVVQLWTMRGYVVTVGSKGCWPNDGRSILADDPPFTTQDLSTCAANAGDNECVACAKAACCAEYQACAGDPVCLCWVGCKHAGNPDSVCALPASCGPLNATSAAADACLDAHCSPQCNGVASMGGTCMCATPSGTTSPPPPPCTPGPVASGQACFGDGDCASCHCDAWTMTCD